MLPLDRLRLIGVDREALEPAGVEDDGGRGQLLAGVDAEHDLVEEPMTNGTRCAHGQPRGVVLDGRLAGRLPEDVGESNNDEGQEEKQPDPPRPPLDVATGELHVLLARERFGDVRHPAEVRRRPQPSCQRLLGGGAPEAA